ncbi:MAG TPA: hypothetical protein P5275_13940 [Saprospiraceae bacterium]|nr:hypothetical protein [Saprospiraceae bacterium]
MDQQKLTEHSVHPEEVYQYRLLGFEAETRRFGRKAQQFSWVRVFVFLALATTIILWIRSAFAQGWWLIITGFLSGLFIYVVSLYQRSRKNEKRALLLARINREELSCLGGNASGWESGTRFAGTDSMADDLDLFGENGLYPHFSRAGTAFGQELVARWMTHPLLKEDEILDRQAAVRELIPDIGFRQELLMQALWEEPKPIPFQALQAWMHEPPFLATWWRTIARLWPFLMAGIIVLCYLQGIWSPLILAIIVALSLVGRFQKKIMPMHEAISGYSRQFSNAAMMLEMISRNTFSLGTLVELKARAEGGNIALKGLSRLANALDGRLNGIAFILTNSLWLQDFHTLLQIEDWKKTYRDRWQEWFDAIAHLEGLHTLAGWAFNHPDGCWPCPVSEGWTIKSMVHPLIPANACVSNDLTLTPTVCTVLITGSNMAGKSTFLRTIGINVLLAQMGTKATANAMNWQPQRLFTSLRINDSLAESTSFFMAELKKLKYILTELETGNPALVLLDEVLKGTNSDDKQYGAEQLIERLLRLPAITFLASHITEMGVLAERHPGLIVNYCFESTIEDNQLMFDYRLRPGIARNKNATFLMKQMGIIQT